MLIEKHQIAAHNEQHLDRHKKRLDFLMSEIEQQVTADASSYVDGRAILQKLKDFQIAIPSWALGTGGTRFGRFSGGGEQIGRAHV